MRCLIVGVIYALLAGPTSLSAAQDAAKKTSEKEPELVIVGKTEAGKAKEEAKTQEGGKSKEEAKPTKGSKPKEETKPREPSKPKDFLFKLGESLPIKATGSMVEKIETEWKKTSQKLSLYFDGVRIAELKSPPQQVADKELRLIFRLDRDANDDASRKAWDTLFKNKNEYEMTIEQPALAIGGDLPLAVHSDHPLKFYVATEYEILVTFVACLAILGIVYWILVNKTDMLRDRGTGYYSLGKSQMAFWGLVVVLSFAGVWYLTRTMERIPPQVLILIGISAATGLGAIVIGNSKKTASQTKLAKKQVDLAKLQEEEQQLQQQPANAPAAQIRLAAIQPEMNALAQEINDLSQEIAPGQSRGFWRDICDDGNGASFHRLQVVIWTVVLGAVFIQSVAQVMSMPEFPDTLLYLMGISNGTYIGFKFPE
jgi:hypothetical protein